MTWTRVEDAHLDEWPKGTEVLVSLHGVLDGYVDHEGQRQVVVTFPMASGMAQGSVLLPPNAEIEKYVLDPKVTCSCSLGHRNRMARYGEPHAIHCPLRSTS